MEDKKCEAPKTHTVMGEQSLHGSTAEEEFYEKMNNSLGTPCLTLDILDTEGVDTHLGLTAAFFTDAMLFRRTRRSSEDVHDAILTLANHVDDDTIQNLLKEIVNPQNEEFQTFCPFLNGELELLCCNAGEFSKLVAAVSKCIKSLQNKLKNLPRVVLLHGTHSFMEPSIQIFGETKNNLNIYYLPKNGVEDIETANKRAVRTKAENGRNSLFRAGSTYNYFSAQLQDASYKRSLISKASWKKEKDLVDELGKKRRNPLQPKEIEYPVKRLPITKPQASVANQQVKSQEQRPIEAPTSQEQHPIEAPTSQEQPPIEAPTSQEQRPIEAPTSQEQRPIEAPTSQEQRPIEAPTSQEEQPSEAPTSQEQRPSEAPTSQEEQPSEAPTSQEEQPSEAPTSREERPSEAPSSREERPSEAPTSQEERPSEAPTSREERPSKAPTSREERPSEAPKTQEERPSEAPTSREERPSEVPTSQEERPSEAPTSREERPSEAPTSREERPSKAPTSREERPSEAPTSQEERPNEAPTSREERPSEAPTSQEERPSEAPTSQEERPSEAPTSREEQPSESPTSQEERPSEAPTSQEERPSEAPTSREERPSEAPKTQEERPSEATTSQEERPSEVPKTQEEQPSEAPTSQEERPSEAPTSQEEQPSESPTSQEEQPSEAPTSQEEQSSEAPSSREERPSEAPTSQEEQPSESPTSQEERPSEAPTSQEEQPSEAPTSQEEQPNEAPTSQEERPSEAPTSQEERPSEAPSSQEEWPSEAPTSQEEQSSEAPTSQEERPSEAPSSQEERPSEAPTSQEERPSEAPTSREERPSEAPTSQEERPSEAPTSREERPSEAPTSREEWPREAPTSREEQSSEPPTSQEERPSEAPTSREEQSSEAPTSQEERPSEVPTSQEERPSEVPKTQEERPSEAPTSREERPSEVPTSQEERPSEVPTSREEQPSEVPTSQEERPSEAPTSQEERPSEAPTSQEERPSEAPTSREERPIEAPTSQEERPSEPPTSQEERPSEPPTSREEQPSEVPTSQEERPSEAPTSQEERPSEAPTSQEERPSEAPTSREERPIEAPTSQEEQPREPPTSQEEQPSEAPTSQEEQPSEAPTSQEEQSSEAPKEEPSNINPMTGEKSASISQPPSVNHNSVHTQQNALTTSFTSSSSDLTIPQSQEGRPQPASRESTPQTSLHKGTLQTSETTTCTASIASWVEQIHDMDFADLLQFVQCIRHNDLTAIDEANGRSICHAVIACEKHTSHEVCSVLDEIGKATSLEEMVCCQDKSGNTPLHYAITMKDLEIVRFFLNNAKSAECLQLLNNSGMTPLKLAFQTKLWEITALLISQHIETGLSSPEDLLQMYIFKTMECKDIAFLQVLLKLRRIHHPDFNLNFSMGDSSITPWWYLLYLDDMTIAGKAFRALRKYNVPLNSLIIDTETKETLIDRAAANYKCLHGLIIHTDTESSEQEDADSLKVNVSCSQSGPSSTDISPSTPTDSDSHSSPMHQDSSASSTVPRKIDKPKLSDSSSSERERPRRVIRQQKAQRAKPIASSSNPCISTGYSASDESEGDERKLPSKRTRRRRPVDTLRSAASSSEQEEFSSLEVIHESSLQPFKGNIPQEEELRIRHDIPVITDDQCFQSLDKDENWENDEVLNTFTGPEQCEDVSEDPQTTNREVRCKQKCEQPIEECPPEPVTSKKPQDVYLKKTLKEEVKKTNVEELPIPATPGCVKTPLPVPLQASTAFSAPNSQNDLLMTKPQRNQKYKRQSHSSHLHAEPNTLPNPFRGRKHGIRKEPKTGRGSGEARQEQAISTTSEIAFVVPNHWKDFKEKTDEQSFVTGRESSITAAGLNIVPHQQRVFHPTPKVSSKNRTTTSHSAMPPAPGISPQSARVIDPQMHSQTKPSSASVFPLLSEGELTEWKQYIPTAAEYLHAGYYSQMLELFQFGRMPPSLPPEISMAIQFGCGLAFYKLGKYSDAIECLKKFEQVASQTYNRGNISLANIYIGDIASVKQMYSDAANHYSSAVEMHSLDSVARDFRLVVPSVSALYAKQGSALRNASKTVDAVQAYRNAIATAEAKKDNLSAHTSLGNLFQSLGENNSALAEYEQSIKLSEELQDRVSLGWAHGNIGNAFLGLYQKDKALHHLNRSLDLTVKHEPTPQAIGRAYNNLGTAYQAMNDLDKAEEYYDLALGQAIYGNDIPGQARVYGNIGNVLMIKKDYERAIPHYTEVLRLSRDRSTVSTAFHNRGCAYYEWAETKKKALLERTTSPKTHFSLYGSKGFDDQYQPPILPNSILKYYKQGSQDLDEVVKFHEESLENIKGSSKGLTLSVSLFESNSRTFHRLQDCLVNLGEWKKALLVAEQSRARSLGELMLKKKGQQLDLPLTTPLTIDQIISIVKSQQCVVVYLSYTGSRLLLWVLAPDSNDDISMNMIEVPLEDDQFDGKSLDYHLRYSLTEVLVEKSFEMYTSFDYGSKLNDPVRNLYKLIGEPLSAVFEKLDFPASTSKPQRVIIIPDSYTNLLPLTCLLDPNGHFLGDDFTFQIMPSLLTMGILDQLPPTRVEIPGDSQNMCVVGNPSIPAFNYNGEVWNLGKLPHATKEAQWVSHILETTPILHEQATKNAVLMRIMNSKVIHIATHGSAVAGFLAFAGMMSSRNGAAIDAKNVLIYPADVEHMNISPALVVLSSCDSGRGAVKADGIIGMARAFILAGAQAVLTTLWRVPDESAAVFMQFFYQYLTDGFPGSEALQKSILSLRCFKKYSQYIHWSGYQLSGKEIQLQANKPTLVEILDKRLGCSSVFPRLDIVKTLESAFITDPHVPTDVQVLRGSPGMKPSEPLIDFIHSFHTHFEGGIFWINGRSQMLIEASLAYIQRTTGKLISELQASESQKILVILDNIEHLPTSVPLIKLLKNPHAHVVVISKCYTHPENLQKEIDQQLLRGCNINDVMPLSMIHTTQRIIHSLLKDCHLAPRNGDQDTFENLAEFTSGSPTIINMSSALLLSRMTHENDVHGSLQNFAESMSLDEREPSAKSQFTSSMRRRSIQSDFIGSISSMSAIVEDDPWCTNANYDSWQAIARIISCCNISSEQQLLLYCLAVFGCSPIPMSVVTELSFIIVKASHHSHSTGNLHSTLLDMKLLQSYPVPVILHPSIPTKQSQSEPEFVYVPELVSRAMWKDIMSDLDQTMAMGTTYKTFSALRHTTDSIDRPFLTGLCGLLLENCDVYYTLVGKKCYLEVYKLFLDFRVIEQDKTPLDPEEYI